MRSVRGRKYGLVVNNFDNVGICYVFGVQFGGGKYTCF